MAENLKQKTATGLFWGLMNNGLMQLLGFIFGIFLGRILAKDDFGMMAMINIFTVVAIALQNAGFASAIGNMKKPTGRDYNSVFWFNVVVGSALYVLLFLCAPLIARYYDDARLTALCRLAFLNILFACLGTAQNAYLFKNLMVKEQAKASVTAVIVSNVVGLTMALCGFAYWSLAVQSMLYVAVNTSLAWNYSPWRPTWQIDFGPVRRMFPFSIKIALTTIVTKVNDNIMNILLGKYYSHAETGSFYQAYNWDSKVYYLLQGMLSPVVQPVLVSLKQDEGRQANALRKIVRFTSFLSFPLLFGLGLVAHEFIILTLTTKWADAVPLLQVLCLSGSVMPLVTILSNVIITRGKSNVYLSVTATLCVVQILLMFGLRTQGVLVMVKAFAAVNIVWVFVWHAFVRHYTGYTLRHFLLDTLPFAAVAAVVMAATHFATASITSLWLLLGARIAMAVALYYVLMRLLGAEILKECTAFLRQKLPGRGR